VIKLNIHEAKTHLSAYLERIAKGETVILCKRNVPVAEIRALEPARTAPRPIGLAKGQFEIPTSFFESLPDELANSFSGGGA